MPRNPARGDFAVVRFYQDGRPDESFNVAGQMRVGIDAGSTGKGHDTVVALALQGSDILVTGTASSLDGDGALDPSDLAQIRLRSDVLLVAEFE